VTLNTLHTAEFYMPELITDLRSICTPNLIYLAFSVPKNDRGPDVSIYRASIVSRSKNGAFMAMVNIEQQ